ncbi:uncharacterized protein LOC127585889 [Pristis pectinata]|uniref:uncharacterized protein LOC127585889 n=1 Tax=Pristis pectinata TaxID=685728 RepID=UPI00223CA416|nr:uncharacterized protein LOC127585889 [Pristis pectinata]XP_051899564.1 uncharacterized protein LOC127585889 [Pristis pectinata]
MNEVKQLATLGRPFQLGMLYDCRSDTLIPGVTLWDLQTLQSNLNRRAQPSTEFHIIASDSMEKKAAALNVSGSLKASLLCGLVEVKGSAKYLNDSKQSKRQARVTLQYKTTTRFEELTMSHLGRQNIAYPSVFDEGSATHVVTAVLYGAQAFFVFDQMVSSAEKMQDIQGNIEATIKCLPMIAIEGDASLTMTEEQKSHSEKFSCTFYGDFSLKNNPTTFQDAIGIYASLPSSLGSGGENSVPVRVWLYPLNKLDSRAIQLVREISVGLVNQCQQALEQLNETVQRCNDMMNDNVTIQFPEIRDRIQQFREMCLEYKLVFQRTLARVLPSIRGGGEEEGLLVDILKNKEQSPFKHQSLITWLDHKEREMMMMSFYLKVLDDIPIVKSRRELDEEVMNPAIDYVVCFTFTALHQEDLYLLKAIDYLRSQTDQKMQTATPATEACATQHGEQWFNSLPTTEKMKQQYKSFLDFATANKENGKIKFLVASVKDDSNRGASIYLYEGWSLKNQCFEPPSQPQRPMTIGNTHDSVTLQLQPPRHGSGEIVGYKVEYKGPRQEDWSTLHTPDKSHSVRISGLQLHQEYHFRYRAVTKVGVSKVSDSYTDMTRPTSPPGKPVFQDFSSRAMLFWDAPTQIGANVKIVQYRIEYREETAVGSNTEGGLWEEVKTTDSQCHYHFEGLKPNTVYSVRVSADCGEAGSSTPSEAVSAKIENEATRIAQKLRREAKLISKGHPSIYKLNLQKEVLDQFGHLAKCSFGKRNTKGTMKTIMLLGATGSGKTTLINGMINYILGVEWTDDFRYTLIYEETGKSQAESQTSSITAYQLHHQKGFKIDYSLTIIDTPGFGDTRGISRDQMITDHIREFFTSPHGVDQIDAVCFVAQASLARLTHTQKYIFDSILSIFGKDIAESIHVLVTFADGQRPPILEAMKVAEIPCPKDKNSMPVHFKFNNSAIFAQRPASGNSANMESVDNSWDTEEDDDNFDEMFWKMGTNSMKKFFRSLTTMKAKSLRLTREVLQERQQLEAAVEGLQRKIRVGLTKMEELRKTRQVMNQHQTELDANKDFEYEVEITVAVQEDISGTGNYITNCQKCRFTCHYPCGIPDDAQKRGCAAMDCYGNCEVCPQKCVWNVHFNQKYRFEYKTKKEKRTYNELKERYEKAFGLKMTAQNVMETLEIELAEVQNAVLELIQQLSQSIRRLEEIALRPNPLSTPAYIDLLIQSEKEEAKPGFTDRIQALGEVRERADLIQKVAEGKLSAEVLNQNTEGSQETIRKKIKKKFVCVFNWITGH